MAETWNQRGRVLAVGEENTRRFMTPEPDIKKQPKPTRHTGNRFMVLNAFADYGARHVDCTAQAVWWILFREIKRNGLATVSYRRIGECIGGVSRYTVFRGIRNLERG